MRAARRVVLTRAAADNAPLRAALAGEDAELVDYPCIAIEPVAPPADLARRLGEGAFEAAVFVSRNAADQLLSGSSPPPPLHVLAIGPKTARVLERLGWPATALASEARAEVAAREIARLLPGRGRVLYVRGERGGDEIQRALRAAGREVEEAVVYRTVDAAEQPLPADDRPTLVVFASPSAVRHFCARNPGAPGVEALAIGPTTAAAAREAGLPTRTCAQPSGEALARAVRAWLRG